MRLMANLRDINVTTASIAATGSPYVFFIIFSPLYYNAESELILFTAEVFELIKSV